MLQFIVTVPANQWLAKAADLEEANKAGLYRLATGIQNIAERKVGDIRKRRIPTRREVALYNQRKRNAPRKRKITASNAPAWEATGALLKAVSAEPIWESPGEVALYADVPHAAPRHALGTPDFAPKNPALGIIRKDEFFADAVEVVGDEQALALYSDGFESVWSR